jgi:tRNA(adenine34) deaminase
MARLFSARLCRSNLLAAMAVQRERASVVCVDVGALLCVRLRDPQSGVERLFPPGGAIEPNESPAQAAAREALEETGYRVRVAAASERLARYPFTWAGRQVDVTTHFFAARLASPRDLPAPVVPEPIHRGVVWLPLEDLERELSFDTTILTHVRALLP